MLLNTIFQTSMIVGILTVTVVSMLGQDKLSAEEILARHLKSFGTTAAIEKSRDRMAVGSAEFAFVQTLVKASGKAKLSSNGKDLSLFSTFDSPDYPSERIGVFEGKITIPHNEQSFWSPLGAFLACYDKMLTARLFGGSIFSTWPIYNNNLNGARIESDGKKKIGDRDAWVVKITPKGGMYPSSYIKLYFDAQEFRHIRTVYRQDNTDNGGSACAMGDRILRFRGLPAEWVTGQQSFMGATLTEDFADFRPDAAEIELPHKYFIHLILETGNRTQEYKWVFSFDEYQVMTFPPNFFSFKN